MLAVAVSVPGAPDRGNQDCAEASTEGDAVAVADGVGSASLSSLGSRTAVSLALDEIRRAAHAGMAADALGELLTRRYREETRTAPEACTTCLFAVTTETHVFVGQAGDGLAGVLLADAWVTLPNDRGVWSNQTEALPRAKARCLVWPRDKVQAVFLASDGVSDDLVPGREPELVCALVAIAAEGAAALQSRIQAWLSAWPTRGASDDRSVALLIPRSP